MVLLQALGLVVLLSQAPVTEPAFPEPLFRHPVAQAASRAFRFGNLGQAARLAWRALLTSELEKNERRALAFLHALALARSGQRKPAVTAFRKVLADRVPNGLLDHAAWHHASLLIGQGRIASAPDFKEARSSLARVPLSSRFGLRARRLLVQGLLSFGETQEACRLAGLAASHFAGTRREAGAILLKARCRERLGGVTARESGWKQAREVLREAASLYRQVSVLWPQLPAGALARESLQRLRERGIHPLPAKPTPWMDRARQIAARLRSRRDLNTLRRIRSLLPRTPKDSGRFLVDTLYGELAGKYRWFRTAYSTLRRVTRNAPDPGLRARAGFGLAGLTSRRNPQAAIQEYLSVQQRWPDTAFAALALYKAGEIARRYGLDDQARKTFQVCVEKYPRTSAAAHCRWGLAWMAYLAGRHEEALTWMQFLLAASNLFPDEGEDVLQAEEEIPIEVEPEADSPFAQEEEAEEEDSGEDEEDLDSEEFSWTGGRPGVLRDVERRRFFERVSYWRARTLEARGKTREACQAYTRVANQHPYGYYALMAWERMLAIQAKNCVYPPPAAADGKGEEQASGKQAPAEPSPLHPEVEAARTYLRMGLPEEARATLVMLDKQGLSARDRREASRAWMALGDVRRAHRMASILWEGGLPAIPVGDARVDARQAYPRAFAELVEGPARHPGVSPSLLFALMRAESGFYEKARSPARALGLTQVVRRTAYRTARSIKLKNFRFWKLIQPEVAIRVGSAHLAELLERYDGHPALALAAYNAGEPSVNRWLARRGDAPLDEFIEEIPYAETNRYVRKLLSFYAIYRALYEEPTPPRPLGVPLALPSQAVARARKQNLVRMQLRAAKKAEREAKKEAEAKRKTEETEGKTE